MVASEFDCEVYTTIFMLHFFYFRMNTVAILHPNGEGARVLTARNEATNMFYPKPIPILALLDIVFRVSFCKELRRY